MSETVKKILRELSYQSGIYTVPPEFFSLIVTMRCNFRCQSCSIWQNTIGEELNKDEWQKLILDLTNELKPSAYAEINGGEPLIDKELTVFIVKELKKYFNKVALNSNGFFIDNQLISQLENAGLDYIKISLYSLNKTTHNNLRGNELAFDKAFKAIELASQSKIRLEVGILITSQNIKESPALIEYLQTLPNTSIKLQPLGEKIESTESKNLQINKPITNLWPSEKDINNFFSWVLDNNKNIDKTIEGIQSMWKYYLNPKSIFKYRCIAGYRSLVVYPNGDVAHCFNGKIIGNMQKQNIKMILRNSIVERKKIKNCKKYCRIMCRNSSS